MSQGFLFIHLQALILVVPALLIIGRYVLTRDRSDCVDGLLGCSLAITVTAVVTNAIKLSVGELRA
jgi:hypothetical protein